MLAVPGALVALGLAYLAALGTVERDRRDLALLRARGATRRDLLGARAARRASRSAWSAGLLGAGVALGAVSLLVNGGVGLDRRRARSITVVVCVALAIAGALAGADRRDAPRSGARASARAAAASRASGKPLWQRLYLDLARARASAASSTG